MFFLPRIGKYYEEGWQGYRTLVLGAHHICNNNCEFSTLCCSANQIVQMDNECPCYHNIHDTNYYSLHNSNIIEIDAYI